MYTELLNVHIVFTSVPGGRDIENSSQWSCDCNTIITRAPFSAVTHRVERSFHSDPENVTLNLNGKYIYLEWVSENKASKFWSYTIESRVSKYFWNIKLIYLHLNCYLLYNYLCIDTFFVSWLRFIYTLTKNGLQPCI